MKKIGFYMLVLLLGMGMSVQGAWAQQPVGKKVPGDLGKTTVGLPAQTKVTSCIKQVTIPVQFDNTFLKNNVDNIATFENINAVPLTITGSNISGDTVRCFYKSQSGDIANLIYKYPCKNGKKGGTAYEHSYTCDK